MLAVNQLRETFTNLTSFLEAPDLLVLYPPLVSDLANRARHLGQLISQADDRLIIGLLGGTGVGKSTLINALADRPISRSSAIRPTTDRVVLYRHGDNSATLSSQEIVATHEVPALSRITLADFPDFDSLEIGHRQTLATLFPRLDLLLWVVDPTKYADQSFYDWLTLAPQAKVNSLFILNKTDELIQRYGHRAGAVITDITADMAEKLKLHAGRPQARILAFSALAATGNESGRHQTGFQALLEEIRQLAETKTRQAVKELNLAAMAGQLLTSVINAAKPANHSQALSRFRELLTLVRTEVTREVALAAGSLMTSFSRSWQQALTKPARDNAPWPLDFFLYIWGELRRVWARGSDNEALTWPPPDLTTVTRRLNSWSGEVKEIWNTAGTPAGVNLIKRLSQASPPDVVVAGTKSLIARGPETAAQVRRQVKWRFRHHLLPLLLIIYPFLAWATAYLAAGTGSQSVFQFQIRLSDGLWWLLAGISVYLLETSYYLYTVHRQAARALARLAHNWANELNHELDDEIFSPAENMARQLSKELDTLAALTNEALVRSDPQPSGNFGEESCPKYINSTATPRV